MLQENTGTMPLASSWSAAGRRTMSRSRRRLVMRLLCAVGAMLTIFKLLLLWTHPLLKGGVGQDMVDVYAGALAVRHGLNPYTASTALGVRLTHISPRLHPFPFVHPPTVALLALPFTWLSPDVAYRILSVVDVLGAVFSAVLLLSAVRVPRRVTLGVAGLVLASGAGFLAAWYGQLTPLMAMAVAASYWLARRGHYAWAGAASTVLLIKPHLYVLALAAILLIGNKGWRKGVLLGTLGFVVAGWLVTGTAGYLSFVQASLHDVGGHQRLHDVDSLGLDSMYYQLLPGPLATALLAATVIAALVAGAWLLIVVRKGAAPDPVRQAALAAALLLDSLLFPYSHQYDSSLLVLPYILAVISLPAGATRRWSLWLTAGAALAPYLNLFPVYTGIRPLPLIDLAMAVLLTAHCLSAIRRPATAGAVASAGSREPGPPWLPPIASPLPIPPAA